MLRRLLLPAATVFAMTTFLLPGTPVTAATPTASTNPAVGSPAPEGSFTLGGAAAASYAVPPDSERVWRATYPDGTVQTRYQQVFAGAQVLGGQVTVVEDAAGKAVAVIGAHFASLQPSNDVQLTKADSLRIAADLLGAAGKSSSELRIDPRTGRFFYLVETQRLAERPFLWVDAANGDLLNRYDGIAEGTGVGIKGDTKTLDTSGSSGAYELVSSDDRQETYDAQNLKNHPGVLMTDPDDVWDFSQPQSVSPSQAAGVDAHYYADVVDDFYADTFSRNSIDGAGMKIISTVHYDAGYCNAFWNGEQMTYGDGDTPATCKPLSGGLDVVGHELTHGVTEFTSGLIYENESGALNEAFSDMMGNTIEFYADAQQRDPAAQPDWLIGEDVIPEGPYGGTTAGFRNMGDPQDDGDPDHYSERYTGTKDNGGVHTNSGIPNHAYYLAVNGGTNAGCDSVGSGGHVHAVDCSVRVPSIGLARAEQIFYQGFTSLTEYANFCDARSATLAVAGGSRRAVNQAWAAVGVHRGCEPAVPPPPPCVGDANAQIPFESPHPYGNNGDCTWTYDNGQAGFRFHFDQLETEAGYDYVYVYDGNGSELARYDGTHPLGQTSPCITTSVGSVRLTTDAAVVDQGFHVDAVEPC